MNQAKPEQKDAGLTEKQTLEKALGAGHWSLLNTLMQKVLIFGTFFITARILTPGDFGTIAIIAIVPSLIDALTALSFESAVVQKKNGDEKQYLNAIWTFNILRSLVMFSAIFFVAPYVANFFHSTDGMLIFQLSGLVILIQSLGNIGQVYFFRDLNYKKVFLRDFATYATISIVSIAGALYFRSYWALFYANVLGAVSGVAVSYALHEYRPRLDIRLSKLRALLPYSQWIFGQSLLGQIARTLEDSLVAHFTNTTEVGLFTKAKGLANAPTSPVVSLINKISFAAYSRVQESLDHVREGLHKSYDLILVIALPFLAAIIIAGHRIIAILLGSQWLDITTNIKVLTIAATIDILTVTLAGPAFNALGKPRIQFLVHGIYLSVLIVALIILVPTHGTFGASIAMLLSSMIAGIYSITRLHKLVRLSFKKIIETTTVVSIAVLLPLPLTAWLLNFPFANSTLGFLLLGAMTGLSYVGIITFFGRMYGKGPHNTLLVIAGSLRTRLNR